MNLLDAQNSKNQKFVIDKIFHPLDVHFDTNSLSAWLSYYYSVDVKGALINQAGYKKFHPHGGCDPLNLDYQYDGTRIYQ